jgi:hypothetical protein
MSIPLSMKNKTLHAIWVRVRSPFNIPSKICPHINWEIYDMDLAGCLECGHNHACNRDTCDSEKNEEGHLFCKTTGCCVRFISFSEKEFVSTVSTVREMPVSNKPITHHKGLFGKMNKKNRYRSWVNCRGTNFKPSITKGNSRGEYSTFRKVISSERLYLNQCDVSFV